MMKVFPDFEIIKEAVSMLEQQETLPKSLSFAARRYAIPTYMKDIDENFLHEYPYDPVAERAFIAGAKWDRSQMMQEAVEGTVMDFSSNQPRPQVDVYVDPNKYCTGDKVRIIIVKEDEK